MSIDREEKSTSGALGGDPWVSENTFCRYWSCTPSWFATLASSLLNLAELRCPLYRDPLELQLMWNNKYYSHSFPQNVQLASSFLQDQSWCLGPRGGCVFNKQVCLSEKHTLSCRRAFWKSTQSFHWWPKESHQVHLHDKSGQWFGKFRPPSLLTWAIFRSWTISPSSSLVVPPIDLSITSFPCLGPVCVKFLSSWILRSIGDMGYEFGPLPHL